MDAICNAWAKSCARLPSGGDRLCTFVSEHGVLIQGPSTAEEARNILAEASPYPGWYTADMTYHGPLDACPDYHLVEVGSLMVLTKGPREPAKWANGEMIGIDGDLAFALTARASLARDAANASLVNMRRISPRGETVEVC